MRLDKPLPVIRYALIALALALYIPLLLFTVERVSFPWDLLLWAEAPFMVDMLKIDQGLPIYSDPALANSFVYSPGLQYITFAFLKPFGLHLDIRFCRLISVGMAYLAAGIVAGTVILVAEDLHGRIRRVFAFVFTFL
ncbi:MAG: hypothetical protein IIB57_15340, partial [Planctomycetes bacterium]|nr:hypothetical protein [Planctomycetota bacterium]